MKCRASSTLTIQLEHQPATIWTLFDQDSEQKNLSQAKIGSLVFRLVALAVLKDNTAAEIHIHDVKDIFSKSPCDSAVGMILQSTLCLFDKDTTLRIIGNKPLNSILVDLAITTTKGTSRENTKKENLLQQKFHE
ncbi:hypothetical protein DM01DRAFT_1335287 [Hesseltinella vesiculosa]|uniref:Uncharacterized protein n=1 Tax=Hesseltinella vesiculosa TaxID=101127 RepID=A0A1X2GJ29_9FUNG|nr:hypothetical protein DM01DRAFT_1335287 [Hesseltinella vesiculosa]